MTRLIWILLFGLPVAVMDGQAQRFRYRLEDDSTLPAQVRRQIDSIHVVEDSIHRCPPRTDTLWAADIGQAIPTRWLRASLSPGCGHSSLPNSIRRRLRDDTTSLSFYEAVIRKAIPATELERAWAIRYLSWSGEPRFFRLILDAAAKGRPAIHQNDDYNVAYRAFLELAQYVHSSSDAREVVWRAASAPRPRKHERQAGVLALAAANTPWSRARLRRLNLNDLDPSVRGSVRRILAHAPCPSGQIFVEHFGLEGQDYSRCELPPDYR